MRKLFFSSSFFTKIFCLSFSHKEIEICFSQLPYVEDTFFLYKAHATKEFNSDIPRRSVTFAHWAFSISSTYSRLKNPFDSSVEELESTTVYLHVAFCNLLRVVTSCTPTRLYLKSSTFSLLSGEYAMLLWTVITAFLKI